jgi:hypothetical protein
LPETHFGVAPPQTAHVAPQWLGEARTSTQLPLHNIWPDTGQLVWQTGEFVLQP